MIDWYSVIIVAVFICNIVVWPLLTIQNYKLRFINEHYKQKLDDYKISTIDVESMSFLEILKN